MIKTNPKSWITHKSLSEIKDFRGVILQTEKTDSKYNNGQELYLCELAYSYDVPTRTMESLAEEIIKLNNENRRLHNKIGRLEKQLKEATK